MSYPVLAFHGTKENNIHSICNTGFKVPGEENFEHATDTGKITNALQKKNFLNLIPKQARLNTVPCVHYVFLVFIYLHMIKNFKKKKKNLKCKFLK